MPYRNPFKPIISAATKSRVFGLDLLRTLAIVLVLYGHCVLLFPERGRVILFTFLFLDPVTLFFVLSGFLIGRILLDTFEFEKLNFNTLFRFWLRRWMRTVPAYLTTLFLLVLIYHKFNMRFVLPYLFFLQNFNWAHPWWFTEAWSLSVEEWFYILIPLTLIVVLFIRKNDVQKTFLTTCLAVIVLVPIYRWHKYETIKFTSRSEWDFLFRMQVLSRLDSIMYGVLGAYILRFRPSLWSYNKKLYLTIGLFLIILTWRVNNYFIDQEGFYSSVCGFSIDSFAVLLILPFFADLKSVNGKIAKTITLISVISYSLYLLNMSFVSLYVCHVLPHFGLMGKPLLAYKVAVYWFVTFTSSIILYLIIEHPFIVLRDRITKKRSLAKIPPVSPV